MLLLVCFVGALVVNGLGLPVPDESQVRRLQTDIDPGKPLDQTFASFKRIFNRSYEDDYEDSMRRKIFEVNIQYIKDHNVRYAKGEHSYYLGVNQFADLSTNNGSGFLSPSNVVLPSTVDWRKHGLVTGVKNQGRCGSCWAFSTTGSLEGQYKKQSGNLISLSEQQLHVVDCSGRYGNEGCNGGWVDKAFAYIKGIGGIEGETDYAYVSQGQTCRFDRSKVRATVSGIVDIPQGSEISLQQAVATVGPVSVAIDASQNSFQFTAAAFTSNQHAVLLILITQCWWRGTVRAPRTTGWSRTAGERSGE